jgi:CubicO group peptidase (beta-lactamase class C family)
MVESPDGNKLVIDAQESETDGFAVSRGTETLCDTTFGHTGGPIPTMSITKSVVGLAIGLLIEEKRIPSLQTPISHWLPEWKGGKRGKVKLIHLMTQSSGIHHEQTGGKLYRELDQVAYVRKLAVEKEPGTDFSYSNEASELLAPIIRETLEGEQVDTYVARKIFEPLGIKEWTWEHDRADQAMTYTGLALRAGDLLKIGQLMLQEGKWEGHTVVPAHWIRASTTPTKLDKRYGMLWWILYAEENSPPDGYFASGWLGQHLAVFPKGGVVGVRLRRRASQDPDRDREQDRFGFEEFPNELRAVAR